MFATLGRDMPQLSGAIPIEDPGRKHSFNLLTLIIVETLGDNVNMSYGQAKAVAFQKTRKYVQGRRIGLQYFGTERRQFLVIGPHYVVIQVGAGKPQGWSHQPPSNTALQRPVLWKILLSPPQVGDTVTDVMTKPSTKE
jgi:hypothetical protein